jgi:nucleotide-binding universal stress UspA family protein
MVNYMVALDRSNYAKAAFYTALYQMKEKPRDDNHLYLITVVEKIHYSWKLPRVVVDELQEELKLQARQLLTSYGKICQAANVNYSCTLGLSNHTGEMICKQANIKNIDFLYIGTRGMGPIKRLLLGSVSRYCVEHCPCSVFVIKGEWGPSEVHSNLAEVIKAEERERSERIAQEKEQLIQQQKEEKFKSQLDLNIVKLAEEMERAARIKEDEALKEKEKQDRVASQIGAVRDEEEERKRRIKEEAIIDDRVHHVQIIDHDFDS